MHEIELEIESAGVQLAGSLCLPSAAGDRAPVVLMVHGTGPLDRNENMPGQALDVFNMIARHVAQQGVASLRYDKRGCGQSGGDYWTTGHHELVADAGAWLNALRQMPEINSEQIFILGHSEGCLIAPQVAHAHPPVAGLLLLCPFMRPVEELLLWQAATVQRELEQMPGLGGVVQRSLARLVGGVVQSQRKLIARIQSGGEDSFRSAQQPVAAKALREMMALEPAAIFARVQTPMLLIGGAKDLQCPPDDVDAIAKVTPAHVDVHILEDLTHVLRAEPGTPSLLGSPKLLEQPVDGRVLDLIANWLLARR